MVSSRNADFERLGGYPAILASLGLTTEMIESSLRHGLMKANELPPGVPASYVGQTPTAQALGFVARCLGATGEEADDPGAWELGTWNLLTQASEGPRAFRLKIWRGDRNTGIVGSPAPMPLGTKGGETRTFVGEQCTLFGPDVIELKPDSRGDGRTLVVLLYRYSIEDGRCFVHYEISIPARYDEDLQNVTEWVDRQCHTRFSFDLADGSDGETYEDGDDSDPDLGRE